MTIQFDLVISILVLTTAVLMVIAGITTFVLNMRLSFYLKDRKPARWEQLARIGSWGPGFSNPFRWLPFLYDERDCEDQKIQILKKKIRRSIFIVMFLLGWLFFIFLFLVMRKS